ncbi:50S ribosomal protein L11 methyltransferase [Asanoa sp. WMMD1127]|uniref:class I SAM-dependent methyltransferase n=1 Tax=Asanoa sp. WMMD1127 TaxID=3016107 RepID=UPI0024171C7E|nr:50S ribosomal protein L11 methyltransferase [Asanoa sp. WMMD1127]MDG4825443.1 50S ribosomal protein L11 methyltransferase [Asanoa sp. WMMD1127]
MDGLRLTRTGLVPEVQLFLAEDPTIFWARLEAQAGHKMPAPFWATAWGGGQAVARYVLDAPETVAGRRVLDLGSGSGLVAIAAAMAGASVVVANDIDPYASAAIRANARVNGVHVIPLSTDLLDLTPDAIADIRAEVVLAGDAFYNDQLADRVLPFLLAAAQRDTLVVAGDPGRGRIPSEDWQVVTTYPVSSLIGEDAELTAASVLTPRNYARLPVPG